MNNSIKNVSHFLCYFLFLIFTVIVAVAGAGEDSDQECSKERRCGGDHRGPAVRFPFRLKDHHPLRCGDLDSGFELSCDENHRTVLNLPRSAKLFVKNINYTSQKIQIYDPDDCLPKQLLNNPNLNLSESLFQFIPYASNLEEYVFFNCSWTIDDEVDDFDHYVPCLSTTPGYGVRAVTRSSSVLSLAGCRRIVFPTSVMTYTVSSLYEPSLYLSWSEPNCKKCEAEGRGCRLKKNINVTITETECFDLPKKSTGTKGKVVITGAILASFALILATIGIYHIYRMIEEKRKHELKIKQFLEDYKTLKATRYTYVDIWRITNQFRQKLGQGAFGTVYKGKLTNNILVAVKVLNNNASGDGEEFINEMGAMGRIHHVNVARLVGFCADGIKRALVFEFLPNGSLEKFIFSDDHNKRVVLGLDKLRDIALGIARGMEYLHHGCDQQILHFDIKPHNILLDHNFVPKISDFGLAKLCSKEKSVVTVTAARGTMGYIAPEVASRNFGKPSYKSDVYSFGILLLEMVGGRKNIDVNVQNASQVYFPEWAYNHLDQGREPGLDTEERSKMGRKMTIIALKCIQWHPGDRPSMKDVVQMLEGDGDNLTVPPNPFAGTKRVATRPVASHDVALEIISEAE